MKNKSGIFSKKHWWFWVPLALILLLLFFAQHPEWVDGLYVPYIVPIFHFLADYSFNLIPFAVGDLLYLAIILLAILLVAKLLQAVWNRQWRISLRRFLAFIAFALILLNWFYLSWGLNYFRTPLKDRLGFPVAERPDYCALTETTQWLIERLNQSWEEQQGERAKMDDARIWRLSQEHFRAFSDTIAWLRNPRPRVKAAITANLPNYMLVSGYFNPFTYESQVNSAMPAWAKPFTACHELSHQAGIGAEDEANFTAFLVSHTSASAFFRYSAYYGVLSSLLRDVYAISPALFDYFLREIHPGVLEDLRA